MDRNLGQDERLLLDALEPTATRRVDAEIVARAFGETANPDDYIPREACEAALGRMSRVVFDIGAPAVLVGAPGIGKSLLLRVFARRHADRCDAIELAYGAMTFEDLCEWTIRLFDEPLTGLPSEDLAFALQRRELLLLIDDASSLPPETAAALGDFARSQPSLHILLAASEGDDATDHMLAALGEPAPRVHLAQPMDIDEACHYMTQRLERWGASRQMLDDIREEAIERAHQLSRGNPRRLHSVAHHVLLDHGGERRSAERAD